MKDWAVRPADKGGGICVETYESIVKDGFEELKDGQHSERWTSQEWEAR